METKASPEIDGYGEVNDINKGTMEYIWRNHRMLCLISLIASIILVALYIFVALTYTINPTITLAPCIILGLYLVSIFQFYANNRKREFEKEIAASLNFDFQLNGDVESLAGQLLSKGKYYGTDRNVEYLMTGVYQNIPLKIFTFSRIVKESKADRTVYATVFECTIPTILPDLILVPVSSQDSATDVRYTGVPNGYKLLELEGDFDTYYHFYIPEGSQIEALQILQPDIMAMLINTYSKIGFEFVGNILYIYPMRELANKEDFKTILGLVPQMYNRILPILQEMQGGHG